jgi:hypothetical protein
MLTENSTSFPPDGASIALACLRHWMQGHILTGEKWGIPFFTYGPFH